MIHGGDTDLTVTLDRFDAYPGTLIKGKDLYRLGVALGFIEEVER